MHGFSAPGWLSSARWGDGDRLFPKRNDNACSDAGNDMKPLLRGIHLKHSYQRDKVGACITDFADRFSASGSKHSTAHEILC